MKHIKRIGYFDKYIKNYANIIMSNQLVIEDFIHKNFGDKKINCFIYYEKAKTEIKNEIDKLSPSMIEGTYIDDVSDLEVK